MLKYSQWAEGMQEPTQAFSMRVIERLGGEDVLSKKYKELWPMITQIVTNPKLRKDFDGFLSEVLRITRSY